MANLTYGWTQSEHFLQNQGTFFDFQKRAGEGSPLPSSCAPIKIMSDLIRKEFIGVFNTKTPTKEPKKIQEIWKIIYPR